MDGIASHGSLTAILAFLAAPAVGFWFVQLASKESLVRCPEGGAIALVKFEARHDKARLCSARTAVLRCDQWPRRGACARGCATHDATIAVP